MVKKIACSSDGLSFYGKRFFPLTFALLLAISIIPSGCAANREQLKPAVEVAPSPLAKTEEITIDRAKYLEALNSSSLNTLRVIELYSTAGEISAGKDHTLYRVFDVKPGSVYAMLGLANADIVSSANGLSINNPSKVGLFAEYVVYDNDATLEIFRGGKAILFKYHFTGELPKENK